MTCADVAVFLREHDNYLILTHKRPDGDAIGCSVALAEMLRGIGKTAWLPAVSDASGLFSEYLEGRLAPADFVPVTVISVDMPSLNLLPDHAQVWRDRLDLAIDHHPSNEGYAKQTWLEGNRAACGELLFDLAEQLGVMNQTIANALYVAVSTDCGCFVYSNTTANTHRVAAALMEAGAEYKRLNKKHFRTKSMARMKLEGLILQNLKLYRDGTIAVAPISLYMMAEAGAGEEDAEDIAALIGQIRGVLYSATIRELKPGECKISLRSGDVGFNASMACARLGGGGHAAAAGCVVHGTVEEAETAIVGAIEAQLAE
jgi:phosphoesterase RecJ-like protein